MSKKELKIKKPSWWEEFVAFAIKGNAMALAVGTIIGAAFSTITKSLTDDIIMPIIAIFSHTFTEPIAEYPSASPCMNTIGAVSRSKENSGAMKCPSELPPSEFSPSNPSLRTYAG